MHIQLAWWFLSNCKLIPFVHPKGFRYSSSQQSFWSNSQNIFTILQFNTRIHDFIRSHKYLDDDDNGWMNKELLLLLFVEAELVRKKQQKHVYYLHVTGYNHLICGKLPLTLIKSRIFNSTYSWLLLFSYFISCLVLSPFVCFIWKREQMNKKQLNRMRKFH